MRTSLVHCLVVTVVWFSAAAISAPTLAAQQHIVVQARDLKWMPAPPSLPPGAQVAVLEGDPTKSGPFTIRLRFPAGYRIPAHSHPTVERLTILSGNFVVTMGERDDPARTTSLTAGGFTVLPAGMVHHARANGATVVQLSSMGPFDIRYGNPAEDPRRRQTPQQQRP